VPACGLPKRYRARHQIGEAQPIPWSVLGHEPSLQTAGRSDSGRRWQSYTRQRADGFSKARME